MQKKASFIPSSATLIPPTRLAALSSSSLRTHRTVWCRVASCITCLLIEKKMECNVLLLFQIIPLCSTAVEVSVFHAGHLRRCVMGQLAGPNGDKREKNNPESPPSTRPHRTDAAAAAIGQVGLQRPRRARRERAFDSATWPRKRALHYFLMSLCVVYLVGCWSRLYSVLLEAFQSISASNIFGTPGWWVLVWSLHKCPQIKHRRGRGEPPCCQFYRMNVA